MRVRFSRGALVFDNLAIQRSAHGVVGTHQLAMLKTRVQFSLGALRDGAVVARKAHILEIDGSIPSPATCSGRGKVWHSAWSGTTRPSVQIRPS